MQLLRKLVIATSLLVSTQVLAKKETILLTTKNSYTFRGAVRSGSVDSAIKKLTMLDNLLPAGKPIYLILDSPGGSIKAGFKMINFVKSLDREVKTISIFAASMAYQFVQAMGERLAVDRGILMAHPGSTSCRGNARQIASCLDILVQLDTMLHKQASERIGMDYKKYRDLIQFDKYFLGDSLKDLNIIDRFVEIKCTKKLKKENIKVVERDFIFSRTKIYSGCPLLDKPLAEPKKTK